MRLRTIWTLPAMALRERLRRTRDWAANMFGSMLPKRVRYFVAIQMISKATIDSPNIPATPLDYVLRNLEAPKSMS